MANAATPHPMANSDTAALMGFARLVAITTAAPRHASTATPARTGLAASRIAGATTPRVPTAKRAASRPSMPQVMMQSAVRMVRGQPLSMGWMMVRRVAGRNSTRAAARDAWRLSSVA